MKSPEYVRDTARIWRRLLDERRAATPDEMRALADAFSRGGFTDGYYTERIDRHMLGVRSQSDKEISRTLEPFCGITRRIPLSFTASIRADVPMCLTVSNGTRSVRVAGEIPQSAINAPLSRETVERNLSKLGGTSYAMAELALELDEGLMVPISHLNDLRRRALAAFENETLAVKKHTILPYVAQKARGRRSVGRSARFYDASQITPAARRYFDRIFLPLGKETSLCDGVVLPPVIFAKERQIVAEQLLRAKQIGVRYALVGNLGHLSLAVDAGLIPVGDFRLNVTNAETVVQLEDLGLSSMLLSPELTLPQARDVGGDTAVIVYGRIPLMTLEKCIGKELGDCSTCTDGRLTLKDRRGFVFPVLREWQHRSVIFNSLPTCMSDRQDALRRAGITAQHFLFSTESAAEVDSVIRAFETGSALGQAVRRI